MTRWTAADVARAAANIHAQAHGAVATTITGTIPPRRKTYKFGNAPVKLDGFHFDSGGEAKRYQELKLLAAAGQILDLEVHQPIYLHANGIQIGYYESDFTYREKGEFVIEDFKGHPTDLYKWKKKHVLAEYGIKIREIRK